MGGNEKALLKHLAGYAEKSLTWRLAGFNGEIEYTYDWRLNE